MKKYLAKKSALASLDSDAVVAARLEKGDRDYPRRAALGKADVVNANRDALDFIQDVAKLSEGKTNAEMQDISHALESYIGNIDKGQNISFNDFFQKHQEINKPLQEGYRELNAALSKLEAARAKEKDIEKSGAGAKGLLYSYSTIQKRHRSTYYKSRAKLIKKFLKKASSKKEEIDFKNLNGDNAKIKLNIKEFKALSKAVGNDTEFLQKCFALHDPSFTLTEDGKTVNDRDQIEFIKHGNTTSLLITDEKSVSPTGDVSHTERSSDPKHVVIVCTAQDESSTMLDIHNWTRDARSLDENYKDTPSTTLMLSRKGMLTKTGQPSTENVDKILDALKEKGYESFSVLATCGGTRQAQNVIDKIGGTDAFCGAALFSPLMNNPARAKLGKMDKTFGLARKKYAADIYKRPKRGAEWTKNIAVYFHENDAHIRKENPEYARRLKHAFGDQVEMHALRDTGDHTKVADARAETQTVIIKEEEDLTSEDFLSREERPSVLYGAHTKPMEFVPYDTKLVNRGGTTAAIPEGERTALMPKLFRPKKKAQEQGVEERKDSNE